MVLSQLNQLLKRHLRGKSQDPEIAGVNLQEQTPFGVQSP